MCDSLISIAQSGKARYGGDGENGDNDVCQFFESLFPIRLGLIINEVFGASNTGFLERVLDYVRSGAAGIISTFGKG